MKIMLIGGAGFIGSQLANKLSYRHKVTVIDNLTYIKKPNFEKSVEFINDSIENISRYKSELNNQHYIFFMASPRLNEINDLPQPLPHLQGLKNTLDYIDNEDTKLIFFSSCSVYGHTDNVVDELSPVKITSLYSKLKIDSENLIKKRGDNRFKIIRLSTLFGLSEIPRNDLMVNNFVKDILFSKYLEVYDPQSWRPNIYLDDLCDVLQHLTENNLFEDVLNIGFDTMNISKQELILTLLSKLKLDFTVKYYAPNDSRNYKVSFKKLKSILPEYENTSYVKGIETVAKEYER